MGLFFKNFYSSLFQQDLLNFRAFNEGPVFIRRNAVVNASSISTKDIDPFRQGVEITQEKHTMGCFKISAGTPGHFIRPQSYGVNERNIVSSGSYIEIDYFNPIEYIKAQEPGTTLKKVVTFPIIVSDNDQAENYNFNGIIEPLSIRPVVSFFSIEFPFESHAVRGAIMAGNSDVRFFSSDMVLTVDDIPTKISPPKANLVYTGSMMNEVAEDGTYQRAYSFFRESWYLDAVETMSSDSGVPQQVIGYVHHGVNHLDPFRDEKLYLKELGITKETHGEDMVEVFSVMTGSTGNYIPPGKKSATTGFVYDNISSVGTDSIAFGGMTY